MRRERHINLNTRQFRAALCVIRVFFFVGAVFSYLHRSSYCVCRTQQFPDRCVGSFFTVRWLSFFCSGALFIFYLVMQLVLLPLALEIWFERNVSNARRSCAVIAMYLAAINVFSLPDVPFVIKNNSPVQ